MSNLTLLEKCLQKQELDGFLLAKPESCRYLSGFTGTDSFLLITPTARMLMTDSRYTEQAKGEAPDFQVIEFSIMTETLAELSKKYHLGRIGLEKETITISVFENLQRAVPDLEFIPVTDPVASLRRIKQPHELEKIRQAAEITDKAFLHIVDFVKPGMTEKEVALELEFYMRRLGAEGIAFDFIVASGVRGALPHGTASDKIIKEGEMLTLDIGCVFQGYHSDLTRTIFIGQPSDKQVEIYKLVLEAQTKALEAIKPGIKGSEVDRMARDVIIQAGYGENFGHGLGHGVGLEIHEGPRLSPRDDSVLEPNMVVTVEPGIYLPGWGGVRIEDLVVLTSKGCEIISKSPKDIVTIY